MRHKWIQTFLCIWPSLSRHQRHQLNHIKNRIQSLMNLVSKQQQWQNSSSQYVYNKSHPIEVTLNCNCKHKINWSFQRLLFLLLDWKQLMWTLLLFHLLNSPFIGSSFHHLHRKQSFHRYLQQGCELPMLKHMGLNCEWQVFVLPLYQY